MSDFSTTAGTTDLAALRRALDKEKQAFEARWNERDRALRVVEEMASTVVAGDFATTGAGILSANASKVLPSRGMVSEHATRTGTPGIFEGADAEARRQAGLTEGVRKAISAFRDRNGTFSVGDVHVWLQANGFQLPQIDPRGRIAMVMQSLRDQGLVEIVQPGSGRTPHTYKAI